MRRRRAITRDDTLESQPVRNESLSWEKGEKGEVHIHVPLKIPRWTWGLRRFVAFPKTRTIVLDHVGSSVWEMCGGEHDVEEMIARLCKQYKLNRKEAEVSLLAYLKQLAGKGLIGLAMKDPGRQRAGHST